MEIVAVVLGCTVLAGPSLLNRANHYNARPANRHYGVVQKRMLVRVAKQSLAPVIPGALLEDLKDEDWKRVPHIEQILAYARHDAGLLTYEWKGSYAVLNKMYLDWLHSVPMNSPLYENGQWVPTFVNMHLKHFKPSFFDWSAFCSS